MKNIILLFLVFSSNTLSAQLAGIISSRFQLSGIIQGERLAWECDRAEIYLNKNTGEFKAYIAVDDLNLFEESEDFESGTEKGKDKVIEFTCQLPVEKVIENTNEPLSHQTELKITYNDLDVSSQFSFTILALPRQGFSIICQGSFNHSDLEVEALNDLEDELYIVWSIIGK
jgi:hypothetical protein